MGNKGFLRGFHSRIWAHEYLNEERNDPRSLLSMQHCAHCALQRFTNRRESAVGRRSEMTVPYVVRGGWHVHGTQHVFLCVSVGLFGVPLGDGMHGRVVRRMSKWLMSLPAPPRAAPSPSSLRAQMPLVSQSPDPPPSHVASA